MTAERDDAVTEGAEGAKGGALQVSVEFRRDITHQYMEGQPDPDWEHVDRAGHVHRWSQGRPPKLPTLGRVEVAPGRYDLEECDCCGQISSVWIDPVTQLQCRYCGEEVTPRYLYVEKRIWGPPVAEIELIFEAPPPGIRLGEEFALERFCSRLRGRAVVESVYKTGTGAVVRARGTVVEIVDDNAKNGPPR